MSSTYRTTWGAKVSLRCWWNFPFLSLSERQQDIIEGIKTFLFLLTVCSEVVIDNLEEWEGVPVVLGLQLEDGVHVGPKQGPEVFTMLHHQIIKPGICLGRDL